MIVIKVLDQLTGKNGEKETIEETPRGGAVEFCSLAVGKTDSRDCSLRRTFLRGFFYKKRSLAISIGLRRGG